MEENTGWKAKEIVELFYKDCFNIVSKSRENNVFRDFMTHSIMEEDRNDLIFQKYICAADLLLFSLLSEIFF